MDILPLEAQGMGLPVGPSPLIPPVERFFMAPGRVVTLGTLKCVMGRRGVQGVEVQAQAEWSWVSMWQHLSMATLTGAQMAMDWLAAGVQEWCLKRTFFHMHDISRNTWDSKSVSLG